MEKHELICIGCPLGCPVSVEMEGQEVVKVTGQTCPKGESYARLEMTNPKRTVTSSVWVTGGNSPTVSVKTAGEVPKAKMADVVRALQNVTLAAPVSIGDVVVADVEGTGVDVIATREVS